MEQNWGQGAIRTESNVRLTQSASKLLLSKYKLAFDFPHAKDVQSLLEEGVSKAHYLDLIDFIEDTDYCKKYYRTTNHLGKNEARDRMVLLKNFYRTAPLLQFEHPMMVIHGLKELFEKRHKRINAIGHDEQSQSQDDQSERSPVIFEKHFNDQQDCLMEMSWSEIILGKYEEENSIEQKTQPKSIEFQEDDHSIFQDSKELKRHDFMRQIGALDSLDQPFSLDIQPEHLSHLLLDFNDMDKTHILQECQRLADKQNIVISVQGNQTKNTLKTVISSFSELKKPMSSSIQLSSQEYKRVMEDHSPRGSLQKQSMMLGSREERYQEKRVMKKSEIIVGSATRRELEGVAQGSINTESLQKKRHFVFEEAEVIFENEGEESPIDRDCFRKMNFFPEKKLNSFPGKADPDKELKLLDDDLEKRYQTLVRKSEILSRDIIFFEKKNKASPNNSRKELRTLKQRPLDLLKIPQGKNQESEETRSGAIRPQHKDGPRGLGRIKSLHTLPSFDPEEF